ncbi:glycosyltransferase family 4 protein [Kocuria coralli]|uniref:D-inositol 3-phosphate glycosyltransferase n=1 Tax=Kocuria coralli TaxID=1461025 RepID=A0A5J5KX59_9MICC|nr:glycosyltransferase [Kocuria coralli]KAA9393860.1 glycosyltransferase family 4 protein [Kocuria coralli]
MTVLIVAETYPPDINGSSHFSRRLAQAMSRRGHDVHVAAPRPGRGPSIRRMDGHVTEHRFRSHTAFTYTTFNFCFPWEIRGEVNRLLDDVKPDVVHIECHYILGRYMAKEAARRGIRLIGTNHFIPENIEQYLPLPPVIRRIYRGISWRDMAGVFRHCDVVTAPTPLAVEAMKNHGFDYPVYALSNGIRAEDYELHSGEQLPPAERPTILFVGRLDPEKHVDVIIKALARIAGATDAALVVVGQGGEYERLSRLAEETGVGNRVHFRGFVPDDELRRAYLGADVFCQPGTAELQSLVTLEAMAASRPVLLANARALPHLVDPGVNGWLFTPGDDEELARKLTEFFGLPADQRRAMGLASRRLVEKHSFGATVEAFERMYRGADPEVLLANWPVLDPPESPLGL